MGKHTRKTTRKQRGGVSRTVGILIGRFQPLHNAHLASILQGLKNEDTFVVCIGQDGLNSKNPYTVEERKRHITASVVEAAPELVHKLQLAVLPEAPEDNNWSAWEAAFNTLVRSLVGKYSTTGKGKLYASFKDAKTQSYLEKILADNLFMKKTKIVPATGASGAIISSTDIRKVLTDFKGDYEALVRELKPYLPIYVLLDVIAKLRLE